MSDAHKTELPESQWCWRHILTAVLLLLIGFFSAKFSDIAKHANQENLREVRGVKGYRYINPLLECDGAQDLLTGEFRPSVQKVRHLVDTYKDAGDITSAAVYFRDLNNGPWFGIAEKEPFAASSMLKVAHLMAVYKAAETDAELLKRPIQYTFVYHAEPQTILAQQRITVGETYTVEELVRRMIVYSDNEALYLLQDKVPESNADHIYADLNLEFTQENEISIRGYSTIFRILFNSSYLDYTLSEQALKLLTQTTFEDGLRAGIPISIPVAHKFGERALANASKQLHDCGVVYYPDHPYLLCVMTRGNSLEKQASVIAAVSKEIYQQMDARYRP